MSSTFKVRLLVICSSSGEGTFVYLKKKQDGTLSLTYSEELAGRTEGEKWVKEKLREVFGHRDAGRLMERNDSFFIIGENAQELNFGVVVPHGQIPNAIGACKKKTPYLLEDIVRKAQVALAGGQYDGASICMSSQAITVIQSMAKKFLTQESQSRVPQTV